METGPGTVTNPRREGKGKQFEDEFYSESHSVGVV